MSKNSRRTLTLLAVPALALGTFAAVAQDAPGRTGTLAPDAAAPLAAAEDARVWKAHGFGGRRGGFGRGGHGRLMMNALSEADANGDRELTQDEVDQFIAGQLTRADADTDGAVSLDEFQVIYLERTRPLMVDAFQALDEDGDGTVTSGELSDRFGTVVERMDRNGDGVLSTDDRRGRERGERRHRRGDR